MIEPMKKLSLVIHHKARSRVLAELQQLGVCHIDAQADISSPEVVEFQQRILHMEKIRKQLVDIQDSSKANLPQEGWKAETDEVIAQVDALLVREVELEDRLWHLKRQWQVVSPFGNFTPSLLDELEKQKLRFAFCSCSKSVFAHLDKGNLAVEVVSESRVSVYFLVVTRKGQKLGEAEKKVLAFSTEVPRLKLEDLEREIFGLEDQIDDIRRELIEATKYIGLVTNAIRMDKDALALEVARSAMQPEAAESVSVLSCWVPERDMGPVMAFLDLAPVVCLVEDPDHHEEAPVKLRQGAFTSLFQPILRLFSLPSYHELDPTPFFAPFYAMYFGMCLADLGYGIILFAGALIALAMFRTQPSKRKYAQLILVLSISAVLSGIVLDDFFGSRLVGEYETELSVEATEAGLGAAEKAEGVFSLGKLLEPLALFKTRDDAMFLPIMLGIGQVMLGWALRVANQVRHFGWQGFGVPTGHILALSGVILAVFPIMPGPAFKIGPLELGRVLTMPGTNAGLILTGVGLMLILLFNGADKGRKLWIRPLAGLWNLYEFITGTISDILSYLRLFALGLAGGLLAESINGIALGIVKDATGILPYIAMVMVLLVGHGLNFGIGMLSAFVHSLRLQFVEFYKAIEFRGGGIEYQPLRSMEVKTRIRTVTL